MTALLPLFIGFMQQSYASGPQVKMSKSGICHPKGGTYYNRTKNYKSFNSMAECLKSGGRQAKR